jgi:tetratricopeptide (TPR) repeat protein
MTSLATLFSLLSLCLYVKGSLHLEKEYPSSWKPMFFFSLSWIGILFAMRTKEITLTVPCLLLLYEVLFFHGGVGRKKKYPYMFPILLTLLIIPLGMINLRRPLGELLSDVSEVSRVQTDLPRLEYLVTQFRVIITYIRLLFLPLNQNLDYDYPTYRSILEPPAFLAFLSLLGLLFMAVLFFRKARKDSNPSCILITYGILWFFLSLAVESSIIPIVDVIFEHRMYLPSVGAFLAIGSACALCWRKWFPGRSPVAIAFLAIAVIGMVSVATYRRNLVWGDSVTLWADVARKSPGKVRSYNNLGASLMDADRYDEAIAVLSTAIRVKPDHPEAYYNMGRAYLLTGRDHEAIGMLTKAIGLKLDYTDAYINLSAAYNRVNQFQETVRLVETAPLLLKNKPEAHFNLGVAYASLGKKDLAFRELGMIQPSDPKLAEVLETFLRKSDRGGRQGP